MIGIHFLNHRVERVLQDGRVRKSAALEAVQHFLRNRVRIDNLVIVVDETNALFAGIEDALKSNKNLPTLRYFTF